MARFEQQGKDDQKLKRRLFSTVGKISALGEANETDQSTIVEVPARSASATELQAKPAPQPAAKDVAVNSATIRSDEDFVTCKEVVRLEPKGKSDTFSPGKVYVFARVFAPKEESLALKLYDSAGKVVWERQMKVRQNLTTGYRTYAFKTLTKAGSYEVRLFNSSSDELARRQFTVNEA